MIGVTQGAAPAAPTFEPAAWLADWSDHGGLVAVIGNRLWIGRTPCLDKSDIERLNALRAAMMNPSTGDALAGLLAGGFGAVEL